MATRSLGRTSKTKAFTVTLEKTQAAADSNNPEARPLFVNRFQVSRHEADWFVDAGVIPIDEILARQKEVRFIVGQRLVMSLATIKQLRDQITEVLETVEGTAVSHGTKKL